MTITRARTIQYVGILCSLLLIAAGYWYWSARAGVKSNTSASQPQGTGRLDSSLVGYWKLDENTGTSAADASTNGNTGTLTNGPTWTTGQIGSSVQFDGTNDHINAGTSSSLILTDKRTLTAWVYTSSAMVNGDTYYIARKYSSGDSNSYYGMALYHDGSGIRLMSYGGGGGAFVYSTGYLAANQWHHVAIAFDKPTVSFYLNGTLNSSGTDAVGGGYPSGSGTMFLGGASGSSYLNGRLDEVRAYDRTLSADEIGELYRLTAPTSVDTSLKSYWSFDGQDISGTNAYDRSGAGNTGTITNGPTARKGVVGQALNFDGSNDYIVSAANSPALASLTQASVAFWINPRGAGYQGGIFSTLASDGGGNGPFSNGFMVSGDTWAGTQTIRFVADGSTGNTQTRSTSTLSLNTWTHVVVVWNGSLTAADTKFYFNGVLDKTTGMIDGSGSFVPSNGNFMIGRMSGSDTLDGILDELRVYNRVLTAAEVKGLYDIAKPDSANSSSSQAQGTGRLDSGLAGYWKLDETTGSSAADASTNGNTGTLTNMENGDWVAGQIGNGLTFDGTNEYISVPGSEPAFGSSQIAIATWVKIGSAPTNNGNIADRGGNAGYRFRIDNSQAVTFVDLGGYSTLTTSATVALNTWTHIVVVGSATGHQIYLNGVLSASNSSAYSATGSGNNLHIGASVVHGEYFNGSIDEFRLYNRSLSADEVGQLYRLTAPTSVDTSLKSYWSFNGQDVNGTTAYDRSGAGNNGTLTNGPTISRGILGQTLSFDGSDDYVTVPDNSALDVGDTADLTLSGWFNRDTFTTDDTIIAKRNGTADTDDGYILYIDDATDQLIFEVSEVGGSDEYSLASTSTFTTAGWNHFTVVWDQDSSENSEIFINGIDNASTFTEPIGGISALSDLSNALPLRMGAESDNGNPFAGKLDEVRTYNRALTESEIKAQYDTAAPDKTNTSVSTPQGTGRLDSGLTGYWKLDETTGSSAADTSTNGYTGTLQSMENGDWTAGRIGNGLDFDGTNEYVNMGNVLNIGSGDVTMAAWINAPNANQALSVFMGKRQPNAPYPQYTATIGTIVSNGGASASKKVSAVFYDGSGDFSLTSQSYVTVDDVADGNWHHIVTQRQGATVRIYVDGKNMPLTTVVAGGVANTTNSGNFTLGYDNASTYFSGKIDEARVYNRALSADEVGQLYRLGTPTGTDTSLKGYWSFNGQDVTATTAYDRSGSNANGTLINGSMVVRGKLGQGIFLDGVDDYFSAVCSGTFSTTTVSFWAKTDGSGGTTNKHPFDMRDDAGNAVIAFRAGTADDIFIRNAAGTNAQITSINYSLDNAWHHYAATADGANLIAYMDGVNVGSVAWTHSLTGLDTCYLGNSNASDFFYGAVDEVRVYNRAFSGSEIQSLYNQGK